MATLGPTSEKISIAEIYSDSKTEHIDHVSKIDITKNIEDGSLIVVTVGTAERPSSKEDMSNVTERMNSLFEGCKGIKILVVPHLIDVKILSLPQLRQVMGEILTSNIPQANNNPIIELDLDSDK